MQSLGQATFLVMTLTMSGGGSVRARYVIACDGARSATRKSLGVKLEDLDFEEPWLVVDAEVDGPILFPAFGGLPADANLQQLSVMLCDPRRPATIVPGRGDHRRWEFMLLPGEDDQAMMTPQTVERLIAPWVGDHDYRVVRAATYRFHGLVAEHWRVDRVFLAGDAAHQTPPFFGQGMCHGLRDVANLAWKLTLALRGLASDRLLDTYQAERDPHVRAVIGAAVAAGRYICQLDPDLAARRDAEMRAAMASAKPGASAADLIPRYEAGAVRADGGDRFIQPRLAGELLDDVTGGGWRLLTLSPVIVSPDAAQTRRTLDLAVLTIGDGAPDPDGVLAAWLKARQALGVLLRPDNYVYGLVDHTTSASALLGHLAHDLALVPVEEPSCIA